MGYSTYGLYPMLVDITDLELEIYDRIGHERGKRLIDEIRATQDNRSSFYVSDLRKAVYYLRALGDRTELEASLIPNVMDLLG